jgi:hypothetical protein
MDEIVIEGVRPWDGRYPFDLAHELTTREWGWIKRLAGYLPLSIEKGLSEADPELFCVFAVIAMVRAGKIGNADVTEIYERLVDAPFGSAIIFDTDAAAEEPIDDPLASSNGSASSSGDGSRPSSETSPAIPKASGTVVSGSLESPPPW